MTTTSVTKGAVVVGVDAAAHTDAAIAWATRYAAEHRLPLTLVHGAGTFARLTSFDPTVTRQQMRIEGRRVTDDALAKAQKLMRSSGVEVEVRVQVLLAEGRDALLEAAADAALLVVGSRGRGTIASVLLGSVSVGVSAHAACPVVVARPGHDDGHVVVGVDGTESSVRALGFAFDTASWQGRKLDVVNTWGGGTPYPGGMVGEQRRVVTEDHRLLVAEALAGLAEKYPDVVVAEYVVENDAVDALVRASQEASLVVVGSRNRGDAAGLLLGSVSREVVEKAHGSVAVVRPGE